MQATKHSITHYYQPTSNSCGYASLAMLLSHYGKTLNPSDLLSQVPQPTDENGKPTGSITAQLATWCASEGYGINFVSYDFLITDLSWAGLSNQELLAKLEQVKDVRDVVQVGGKHWTRTYIQAYIDLLQAGANLAVKPHVTSKLLYDFLKSGPVYVNICSSVVHGTGRAQHPEPESNKLLTVPDDIHGTVGTHSVVIYGNDSEGKFLVADPWNGLEVIDTETMLCGITAAELECDSQCFQITKKDN